MKVIVRPAFENFELQTPNFELLFPTFAAIMSHESKKEIIFGIRPVLEALEAGKQLSKVLIQKNLQGDLSTELMNALREHEVLYQILPLDKLNRVTKKNHQGVVCFLSPVTFQKVEDILPTLYEQGKVPLFLMLDRITDVRNFGAIARTAECSGVDAIIIPTRGAAAVNGDAVKTSTGALLSIPVCREENLKVVLDYLTQSGIQIVGCTEKTDDYIYAPDFTLPTCIIMGSEEDGVSPEYLKRCDHRAKIPMHGAIGSLNVSVAAGIILYELVRQRS